MKKQLEVQRYLATVPLATLDEIYANVSFSYYCNEKKHLGALLSRLVKSKKIERVKKGVFKYVESSKYIGKFKQEGIGQTKLF
jgi:hypothetical protein